MTDGKLRYLTIVSATVLIGLLIATEQISGDIATGLIIAILGVASADVTKHWNDNKSKID